MGIQTVSQAINNEGYGAFSLRNKIINGAFDIWQRGTAGVTTFTNVASNDYTADRFKWQYVHDGQFTVQKVNDAPTAAQAGIYVNYCMEMVPTTADTSIAANQFQSIIYRVEGYDAAELGLGLAGTRYMTLSFWVKSNVTGKYTVVFKNQNSTRQIFKTFTIDSSGIWEKKVLTVPTDTTNTNWDHGTGIGLQVCWMLAAGSDYNGTKDVWQDANLFAESGMANIMSSTSNYFRITLVQLEKGSVATPFEYRPYQIELNLCRRYYYQHIYYGSSSLGYGDADFMHYGGVSSSAYNWMWAYSKLPVPMRTSPTITTSDDAGTTGKVTIWTSGGGGVTNGITPYTLYNTAESYSVSVYNEAKYGLYGAIKADAEL